MTQEEHPNLDRAALRRTGTQERERFRGDVIGLGAPIVESARLLAHLGYRHLKPERVQTLGRCTEVDNAEERER